MSGTVLLTLPGYEGSGPAHWQSMWERSYPDCRRVEQADWVRPQLDAWMDSLREAVAACDSPPVLVAHSLGCALVAHHVAAGGPAVRAALLVAPADVGIVAEWVPEVASFAPMPTAPLGIASTVVTSTDDPYITAERAGELAAAWGAELVTLPGLGHINADSGLGEWAEGKKVLERLLSASG